jgi:hypothetical protein
MATGKTFAKGGTLSLAPVWDPVSICFKEFVLNTSITAVLGFKVRLEIWPPVPARKSN